MRLKRKKLILIFLIILIPIFLELSLYILNNGNLIVLICNDSNIKNAEIEVYIDNVKVIDEFFSNEVIHYYKKFSLKVPFGNHTIVVKNRNKSITKEYRIYLFTVKWLFIDFLEDTPNADNDKYIFNLESDFLPLLIKK